MLRNSRILLAVTAAAALAFAGCSVGDDGPRTSEEREVGRFTRIANASSVDVELRVGEPQRIVVRAGQKVIDDVGTEVHGGTLHVTFDHRGFGGDDVTVQASVPKLTGIDVDGSGDVIADGVRAARLRVASDGSGDVAVRGSATRLVAEVDGSGEARLEDLAAREARVEVGGSGDAEVSAGALLDVAVDGSGDVSYHGDPDVRRSVDGSGDVSRAGWRAAHRGGHLAREGGLVDDLAGAVLTAGDLEPVVHPPGAHDGSRVVTATSRSSASKPVASGSQRSRRMRS